MFAVLDMLARLLFVAWLIISGFECVITYSLARFRAARVRGGRR